MLSDDTIKNKILHREIDKSVKLPFVVPTSYETKNERIVEKSKGLTVAANSKKTLKLFRPETLKRAHNDAIMAASIGDLEWLKQTLKITSEIFYDKNGFTTIHLASIHGRLNILRFLVEEKSMDPNFPSNHGWRPIHLCINSQIGQRAINCLRYLVEQGVDINVKNEDNVTPLHIAATEGQLECLKTLLELRADTQIKDIRGHTALELAKIWGHRACGKLLSSVIWQEDKKDFAYNDHIERQVRTQDVLKEIEKAHFLHYETKEESEDKFNEWLISQGFKPRNDENAIIIPNSKLDTSKAEPVTSPETNSKEKRVKTKRIDSTKKIHEKDWNYSTKAEENDYVTNLDDFYPRNPFTQMPENLDLVLVNKELKGMSLEQVKEFMHKKIANNPNAFRQFNSESERPVYYRPKNVIDLQTKVKLDPSKKGVDEAGVNLTNDPKSFPFRQIKRFVAKSKSKEDMSSSYGNYTHIESTVKLIKQQLSSDACDKMGDKDKLNIIKQNFGNELSDYMMDKRHGKLSQKYEKVFIC